jgi:hypothetical protein
MVPHQVPFGRHPPSEIGVSLDPSALEEHCRSDVEAPKLVQDPCRVLTVMRPVRMLRIERESDAKLVTHFSTPVITMPRMNARWAKKKTTIGIRIVMSVAAWMYCGSDP